MKKIVVACGSGIATSTAVEAKVKDLLDNNGLSGQYTITKCAIARLPPSAPMPICSLPPRPRPPASPALT